MADAEAGSTPYPVAEASLLLVVGEPWSNQHRQLIVERLKDGECIF